MGDFRFSAYNEPYLYFLLPQLEPGTHHIEMEPGIANAADLGLADELRSADVVILSTMYDNWDEKNTSVGAGSDEPNWVLDSSFCLHGRYGQRDVRRRGTYELYVCCV